jgi:hypothetical protein
MPVTARHIDNLTFRDTTVHVSPIAPTPTVSGGRVGDLLAVAVPLSWGELSHRNTTTFDAYLFRAAFSFAHRAR